MRKEGGGKSVNKGMRGDEMGKKIEKRRKVEKEGRAGEEKTESVV